MPTRRIWVRMGFVGPRALHPTETQSQHSETFNVQSINQSVNRSMSNLGSRMASGFYCLGIHFLTYGIDVCVPVCVCVNWCACECVCVCVLPQSARDVNVIRHTGSAHLFLQGPARPQMGM